MPETPAQTPPAGGDTNNLTGYGPSRRPPMFSGAREEYETWEMRFMAHLTIVGLKRHIEPPAQDASEQDRAVDSTRNDRIFCELVEAMDSKSLSLIMYDAKGDGRKALQILNDYYRGTGQPQKMALYTQLCNLSMSESETITEYLVRAERLTANLRAAKETIADALVIAMIMKGLPSSFNTLVVLVTQSEKVHTLQTFKTAVTNFVANEELKKPESEVVMKVQSHKKNFHEKKKQSKPGHGSCYICKDPSHMARTCPSGKPYCLHCKIGGHTTKACRKKDNSTGSTSVKNVSSTNEDTFAFICKDTSSFHSVEVMVDTGATAHIIKDKELIKEFIGAVPENHTIELADGKRVHGIVEGRVIASVPAMDLKGTVREMTLNDALYIPSFGHNIMSINAAVKRGATAVFMDSGAYLEAPNGTRFPLTQRGRLYYLTTGVEKINTCKTLEQWHRTFGHCNVADLKKTKNVVVGMEIKDPQTQLSCQTCHFGKMTHLPLRGGRERATKPLDLVHTDLAGPITPVSQQNRKYAICFVDDYSGMIFTYFLKEKNQATSALKQFLADVAPVGNVKKIRSDQGGEFLGEFKRTLVENKIQHEMSSPHTPQQNGTAERCWKTTFDMARCLLLESEMPKNLWTLAVATSAYVRNRCFQQRTEKTAYELFTGRQPKVHHMMPFGSQCSVLDELPKTKLAPRAKEGTLVGYDRESPCYLVYLKHEQKVVKSRNVKFIDNLVQIHEQEESGEAPPEPATTSPENASAKEVEQRPRRETKRPAYLDDYVVGTTSDFVSHIDLCCKVSVDLDLPQCFADAISSPDGTQWKNAMDTEYQSLVDNETWSLESLPDGVKPIGGKWVFTKKLDQHGNIDRFKARFVAQGYAQIEGVNFKETFSPTVRMTTVRSLIQCAVNRDWYLFHLDVKTAYLHAPIDFDVFVHQPEGYEVKGENDEKLFCHLKKSLYGLKQSGRLWNQLLTEFLTNQGFIQSDVEPCLFMNAKGESDVCMRIIVFVDDMILAGNDHECLSELKTKLSNRFKMVDLGEVSWFLGIEIEREGDCIKLNQKQYLKKLLKKHGMDGCKPVSTPCETQIFDDDDQLSQITVEVYQSVIGSLVYAMCCTRPDLCWIVTKLAMYMSAPVTVQRWHAVKRVLRYIQGTLNYSLVFKKSCGKFRGFCDSDWGGSNDRKSTSGFCFTFNEDCENGLISWKSKRQSVVALSTCEAEYIALTHAVQEALFLKQLLNDIDPMLECEMVTVFGDNKGAISLAHNPGSHDRSKHIDIRYNFIRDHVQKRDVELLYLPTHMNVADFLTKCVGRQVLQRVCETIFEF